MTLLVAYGLLIYGIFICGPKNSGKKKSQYDLDIDKIIANRREIYNKYNEKKLRSESYCKVRLLWLYSLYKVCKIFLKAINFFSKVFNDGRTYVGLNIFFAIFICINIEENWLRVAYICFFILLLILFLILYFSVKEIKNRIGLIIFILVFTLLVHLAALLPFSDIHADFYKIFLQSRSLASDHAEIYLKDKNESIRGKLIFDDGKYAYVEFDRTYSNCIDIGDSCIKTIRRKVPSEDVSIVVSPKKQQDKQPEIKYQEVE